MYDSVLGKGIYDYSEAARIIGVRAQRLSTWFRGLPRARGPVLPGEYSADFGHRRIISFLDLIEADVAAQLRGYGVSLICVRKAHSALGDYLKTQHPFSHQGIYTDGRQVFLRVADESRDEQLMEVSQRQQLFTRIVLPHLDRVEYSEDTQLATRWRIYRDVVLDPCLRYGKPIVESCAMPTALLSAAYDANGRNNDRVAEWYGIASEEVRAAVRFERHLRRRVA